MEEIGMVARGLFPGAERLGNNLTSFENAQDERSASSDEEEFCRKNFATSEETVLTPRKSPKKNTLDSRLRRLRANDRERRRIQAINDAMEALRKAIPNTRDKRKITKLELLRLAQDYIRNLSEMLCSVSAFKEDVSAMNFSYPTYTEYFGEPCFT